MQAKDMELAQAQEQLRQMASLVTMFLQVVCVVK